MAGPGEIAIVIGGLVGFILICVIYPPFAYVLLAIILAPILVAIVWTVWSFWKREKGNTSPAPTSAQQAGDASDIRSAPDANTPTFTLDHGGEGSVVLQPPSPVVLRGIDNGESYLERLVTHPESLPLLPMHMDGTDG